MRQTALAASTLLAGCLLAGTALAHATLAVTEAPAGSTYKAVIQIGHGCAGAATTAIRVRIPEGVINVHPMPKPGWELATESGPYAQPYDYYGEQLTEGVTEVRWTGGSLPDAWYDEFVFRAVLPAGEVGTVIRFPIVQECAQGVHRWIEIPQPGEDPDSYAEPAPGVTLTAPAGGH